MKKIDPTMPDFEDLISNGCVYVDKTEYVWKLVNGFKYNFISRPRRFGKTLLLSTLKCFFKGKKELFRNLAIGQMDYNWKEYPVIHLDFGKVSTESMEIMEESINQQLTFIAKEYQIDLPMENPKNRFASLLFELSRKSAAIVLVDEYDHPILDHINQPDLHRVIEYYRGFYRLLKAESEHLRFVLVTGVSNIGLTSFYSSFNNPKDLSHLPEYATLFGYTQNELNHYFAEHITGAANTLHKTEQFIRDAIKSWYDGYRFEDTAETVYNPVSIGNFFTESYKFSNFWIRTGTPHHLLSVMKNKDYDIDKTLSGTFGSELFDPIDPEMGIPVTRLLLQSGYLTIKKTEMDPDNLSSSYQLCYPNREVEISFHILQLILRTGLDDELAGLTCRTLLTSLQNCDLDALKETLMTFYSKINYASVKEANREAYYQIALNALCVVLNDYTAMEYRTNNGSIDMVVKTRSYLYLFEFKINRNAKTALTQIKRKKYFQPFMLEPREIVLIGVNFNTELRQIDDWKTERIHK